MFGKPDRPSEGWEDDLVAEFSRRRDEPDELLPACRPIGADAELGYLIYDGPFYSTATVVGPTEEADYLRLPGFLDADQMRLSLRQRQNEQPKTVDAREKEAREEARESSSGGGEGGAVYRIEEPTYPRPQKVVSEVLPELWKELDTLASMTVARTGRSHGQVHNKVRRVCDGPLTALYMERQLCDRISYLHSWQGFK